MYIQQFKYMTFLNSTQLIRKTQHLVCLKRVDLSNQTPKTYYEYQFKDLANPFQPLLIIFIKLTLPTNTLLTKELIQFMLAAVKVYRQYQREGSLLQQFFGSTLTSKNQETVQPLVTIMKQMMKNTATANSKMFLESQKYPPMMSVLRNDYQVLLKDRKVQQDLRLKIERSLGAYFIIPRQIKLARVKDLAKALEGPFQTKLQINSNSLTLITKGTDYQIDQMVTLQMLMHASDVIDKMDEQVVEFGYRRLLEEVVSFQKCTQEFYKGKKANILRMSQHKKNPNFTQQKVRSSKKSNFLQYQNNNLSQLNQSYLELTPQNVICFVEKLPNNPYTKQDFKTAFVKMKSQNKEKEILYRVNPEFCSIDISISFLNQLGIRSTNSKGKRINYPISIRNQLYYFYPLPPLQHFDFTEIISQKQKNQSRKREMRDKQIGPILAWLLVVSAITSKFLQQNPTSIYQQDISSTKIVQSISEKSDVLGSNVKTLLLLYENQNEETLQIQSFQFSTWSNILRPIKENQMAYFQNHKYDKAKLLLETMNNFFYDLGSFKSFVQRTNYLTEQPNIARYLLLFLVSKLIQVIFQREIVLMYQQEPDNLWKEEYGLKEIMAKHKILQDKIEDKLKRDYTQRSEDDQNKKYLKNPIFTDTRFYPRGFYKQLVDTKFGDLCKPKKESRLNQEQSNISPVDVFRNQQQTTVLSSKINYINTMKQQIKRIVSNIVQKDRKERQKKSRDSLDQFFLVQNGLLVFEALLMINSNNYSEIKEVEAEVQKNKQVLLNQSTDVTNKLDAFFQEKQRIIRNLKDR